MNNITNIFYTIFNIYISTLCVKLIWNKITSGLRWSFLTSSRTMLESLSGLSKSWYFGRYIRGVSMRKWNRERYALRGILTSGVTSLSRNKRSPKYIYIYCSTGRRVKVAATHSYDSSLPPHSPRVRLHLFFGRAWNTRTYTLAYIRGPLRAHVHGIAQRSIIRRPALAVASRRDGRMNGECSLNIRTSPLNSSRTKILCSLKNRCLNDEPREHVFLICWRWYLPDRATFRNRSSLLSIISVKETIAHI